MNHLFERQDSLNNPIESLIFDSSKEVFPVKPHWHYFAEIIRIISGKLEVNVDDKVYRMREGDALLLLPSSVHSMASVTNRPEDAPVYYVVKFDLNHFPGNASYAPSSADIFKFAKSKNMPVFFEARQSDTMRMDRILRSSVYEMQQYLYGADVILKAHLYLIIYGIVRYWIDLGLDINECPISPKDSYGIDTISEYIDSHLNENIRVTDLAALCHVSYSGFAAKFKDVYGMSCKEYIEQMRMFKAEEYLLFTNMEISEISELTGFSDSSHFIHSFRDYKGITPKQYRMKRLKKKDS